MSGDLSRERFAELEATLMLRGAGRHKLASPAATQAHFEAKQERQGFKHVTAGQGFGFGDYYVGRESVGRFSCKEPNTPQSGTITGRFKLDVPKSDIVGYDFAAAELRLLAAIQNSFIAGLDPNAFIPDEEKDKDENAKD